MATKEGTIVRKAKCIGGKGSYEIWVMPAEAAGWRATMFKRHYYNRISILKQAWCVTKAEATEIAKSYKKYL